MYIYIYICAYICICVYVYVYSYMRDEARSLHTVASICKEQVTHYKQLESYTVASDVILNQFSF